MVSDLLARERFRRDHRWARRYMSDYLDEELDAARRTRMEGHLAECAECRRLLAGLRRILHGLPRLSTPSATVDALQITASVRARLSDLD